jgi:hypothetical protein
MLKVVVQARVEVARARAQFVSHGTSMKCDYTVYLTYSVLCPSYFPWLVAFVVDLFSVSSTCNPADVSALFDTGFSQNQACGWRGQKSSPTKMCCVV